MLLCLINFPQGECDSTDWDTAHSCVFLSSFCFVGRGLSMPLWKIVILQFYSAKDISMLSISWPRICSLILHAYQRLGLYWRPTWSHAEFDLKFLHLPITKFFSEFAAFIHCHCWLFMPVTGSGYMCSGMAVSLTHLGATVLLPASQVRCLQTASLPTLAILKESTQIWANETNNKTPNESKTKVSYPW